VCPATCVPENCITFRVPVGDLVESVVKVDLMRDSQQHVSSRLLSATEPDEANSHPQTICF
jgi:hypothetical protein